MPKIVTVAAYKGGVGKTTLALELVYLLDAPLVDLDWDNGGATRRWGFRPTERSPLLDALERDRLPRPCKGRGKPDLIPGDRDFEVNQPAPEQMATALEKWAVEWDRPYVVVDTHPGGGRATLGAMNAASVVVAPVVLATAELDGLEGLIEEAADYPLLVVPNKVPRIPKARHINRLRELTQRYQVPVGPIVSQHTRLPDRSARIAISALDPLLESGNATPSSYATSPTPSGGMPVSETGLQQMDELRQRARRQVPPVRHPPKRAVSSSSERPAPPPAEGADETRNVIHNAFEPWR